MDDKKKASRVTEKLTTGEKWGLFNDAITKDKNLFMLIFPLTERVFASKEIAIPVILLEI